MKAACALLLLVALAVPGFAQAPDDRLIVPGQRIGKWTVAMTVEAIVRKLGEPPLLQEGLPIIGIQTQPGVLAYDWRGPSALGLATRDDRTVLILYTSGSLTYKTATGLKYGAPLGSVESAYGEPTATILVTGGSTVIYERLGLAVRYGVRSVGLIAVFRPGSARRIWKF